MLLMRLNFEKKYAQSCPLPILTCGNDFLAENKHKDTIKTGGGLITAVFPNCIPKFIYIVVYKYYILIDLSTTKL